jgi:hypothetical protein
MRGLRNSGQMRCKCSQGSSYYCNSVDCIYWNRNNYLTKRMIQKKKGAPVRFIIYWTVLTILFRLLVWNPVMKLHPVSDDGLYVSYIALMAVAGAVAIRGRVRQDG